MKLNKPKKILILGSGALKIGEAGEFDYSGSQAIKAFKEEGIETVLINPNIATIQTSEHLADQVYFLPITEYFVEEIIKKEKPDAVAVSFGGQTALNCSVKLEAAGVFKKYNVRVLGTPIKTIDLTEDRQKFADHLHSLGLKTPQSKAANTLKDSIKIANEIGYPVMVRAAFALGGQKSGVAFNEKELTDRVNGALSFAPQVLVEKYLHHFKEIEYEVIRDAADNCVTVCNMENMDPLGIHTGESIVVAPSQTLTNYEYHYLREVSMKLVRSLGVVGECNVQFALSPKPQLDEKRKYSKETQSHLTYADQPVEYYIIEMNARLSRSSALASKATGYPLAYVAAKLALGYNLTDIENQVTKVTQSAFEPALDYLVTKVPRWDLEKFAGVEEQLGSSMKSVGEVMAIGRTFEETIQKAIRMLDIGRQGITDLAFPQKDAEFIDQYLKRATPKRIFALAEGFKRKLTVEKINQITGIDPWFLHRIKAVVDCEIELGKNKLEKELLIQAKQTGFSDSRIATLTKKSEQEIRETRKKHEIVPSVFQIDTLAGEFPAQTNYLYMTYHGGHHDVQPLGKEGIMVLGSGPYRIGSSVEFDWTCVNTALSLNRHNKKSIIINCNPETVSTDYDISDRLYFEELTFERVADIYDFEQSHGVIVSVGGQTPNTLTPKLAKYNVHIMGTSPTSIDMAEDRGKFSAMLDELEIPQPEWNAFTDEKQVVKFAEKVGYPVLVRPSYVLSGAAMRICYSEDDLKAFIAAAQAVNKDYPVTVTKFHTETKEIEYDAVAQDGEIIIHAITEHIEHAGVHSGDATMVFPPQRVFIITEKRIKDIARKLAKKLNITGPFNIQFLAKENKVSVIETNLRASRTFPLVSKALKINFANAIVDAMFGQAEHIHFRYPDFVLVKSPQFSFSRLEGADPILRVEMSSTGEVACFGDTIQEAYMKSILATGAKFDQKAALLSVGTEVNKNLIFDSVRMLHEAGYKLYATIKTHEFLKNRGISSTLVNKVYKDLDFDVLDVVNQKKVGLVVIIDSTEKTKHYKQHIDDNYHIRRATVDNNIPLVTNMQAARILIDALCNLKKEDLQIKPWSDYV
ncbi:MAG: carbamoyl-phosphate synthase (glutamine-hydrolyzing) large subunit [Weeksellaceae bacterium]